MEASVKAGRKPLRPMPGPGTPTARPPSPKKMRAAAPRPLITAAGKLPPKVAAPCMWSTASEYVTLRAGARHGLAPAPWRIFPLGDGRCMAYGGDGAFIPRGVRRPARLCARRLSFQRLRASMSSMRLCRDAIAGYARLGHCRHRGLSASSEQVDQYGYYAAANANDADGSTAWAEGADGAGEGEWLSLFFERAVRWQGFAICAGYQRSADDLQRQRPSGAHPRERGRGERTVTVTLEDRRATSRWCSFPVSLWCRIFCPSRSVSALRRGQLAPTPASATCACCWRVERSIDGKSRFL